MPARHAKSIALTAEWKGWVDDLVAGGEYKSASEVVRDGLRALAARRELHSAELEEIRARINKSLIEANAGNFAEGSGEEAIQRAFNAGKKLANS